jgi:hypothetical protein
MVAIVHERKMHLNCRLSPTTIQLGGDEMPNKTLSDRLEVAAKETGFLDYFGQVNFSGDIRTPDQLNTDVIHSGK